MKLEDLRKWSGLGIVGGIVLLVLGLSGTRASLAGRYYPPMSRLEMAIGAGLVAAGLTWRNRER